MVRSDQTYLRAPAQSWPDDSTFWLLWVTTNRTKAWNNANDFRSRPEGFPPARFSVYAFFHSSPKKLHLISENWSIFRSYGIRRRVSPLSKIVEYWGSAFYLVQRAFRADLGSYLWSPRGCQSALNDSHGSHGVQVVSQGWRTSTLNAVLPVLTDLPRLFQALSYTSFNRSLPSEDAIKSNAALAAFLREMLSIDACEGTVAPTSN